MGKQYQTRDATASTPGLTLPEEVGVALAKLAHSATEGLLALAVPRARRQRPSAGRTDR